MAPTLVEQRRLRERLYREDLPSGLRAFVLPKPGFQTRYATFATRYGSNDQSFVDASGNRHDTPAGIAHFLEHKLFEEEDGNVSERFSALGAMANAYTNYTATTYLFSTATHFPESLQLLLEFVQHPYFTPESVTKEQGIIEQELRMYLDDPRVVVFQNLMEALYHAHPVREEIGGTVESIRRITADDLYLCYRTFYHPGNMVFFATGDVDPGAVFDAVHRLAPGEKRAPVQHLRPEEPSSVCKELVRRAMPVGVPLLDLGFKDDPVAKDPLRREVEMEILLDCLFGTSSDIYQTLYEEGLVSEHFAASYFSGDDFAASVLGGPTPEPDRLHDRILALLSDQHKAGLAKEAFDRSRRKSIGEFVALFNSPEAVAHSFSEYALRGLDLFDALDALEAVRFEDIVRRFEEHLAQPRTAVSIIDRAESQ
ncbi:MAG: pitrilysin family protein [Thermaerobacter sp.]|nr:pitrilysin family protein [Thermaerobacter sp.]